MLCSLKDLYRIGPGPSSSHTIGPYRICLDFLNSLEPNNYHYVVTLFGSLALTGKGHLTDKIIIDTLKDVEVKFDLKTTPSFPNTMQIEAYLNDKLVKSATYYSIGGGQIEKKGEKAETDKMVYPFSSFKEIREYIEQNKLSYLKFVKKFDDEDIEDYLKHVLNHMEKEIEQGLATEGYIAGKLHIKRIAPTLYKEAISCSNTDDKRDLFISTYAYAVSESNSGGSLVVTAPTCGSAGVLPAVLYYLKKQMNYSEKQLIDALIIAGLIGCIIKKNATISGAVGGCQAEIGSATCMAAGALCAANGLGFDYIEYASEMALEHQLGLTCDPVGGYVAIPCIERNSISAIKAFNSYVFAKHLVPHRHNAISLDEVIAVMKETGIALSTDYKETAKGGLAKIHKF